MRKLLLILFFIPALCNGQKWDSSSSGWSLGASKATHVTIFIGHPDQDDLVLTQTEPDMKKEIKKLHEDMAAYSVMDIYKNTPEENIKKLSEFQIRLVEIVKQMIEKEGRKKNGNGK